MQIFTYEIEKSTLQLIIEISKKMKSHYTICYGNNSSIEIRGLHDSLGLMKCISDDKLFGRSVPIGIAIESKYLNELEKEIKENKDATVTITAIGCEDDPYRDRIDTPHLIFSKTIRCGCIEVPLLEFGKLFNIVMRIQQELMYSQDLEYRELQDNQEFLSILETKTGDGISPLRIGDRLIYVAPNMLNILKDDTVSVYLKSAYIGTMVVFFISRPKKKCNIQVIFRVMDIRKQP